MESLSVFGLTKGNVEKLLICQVCSEKYDDGGRTAKFLPCLHGVCVGCLGQCVRGDKQVFKCPVCQRDTPCPESGIQGLPGNFLVRILNDYQRLFEDDCRRSGGFSCGSCKDGGTAVSYCSDEDCKNFLCVNCEEAHGRLRIYDGHVVLPLEQVEEHPEILVPRRKPKCKQHRQPLTVFCNEEGCQRPMCLVCVPTAHPGHSVVDLDQKSTKVKEELQNLAQAARKKKGTVEEISGRISTEINQTSARFEEMMSAISAMFDSLQSQLKTRQETVNATLKKLCLDRTDNLKHPTNYAESLVSQYDSACQFAERACEIGNPVDLLGASEQIISRLYELIDLDVNQSLPFQPADEAFLSFTEDHEQVLSEIERLISTLGQLNTSITDQALGLKVTFPAADSLSLVLNATHKVRIYTPDPSSPSLDHLSGALHAYLQSPDGSSVECKEGQQWSDCYELEFQPLVAGPHQLNISVFGVPITGSPFQVVVVDNPSSTADDEEAERSQDEVRSDVNPLLNVNSLHPDSTTVSTRQLNNVCPPNTAVLNMPYTITLQTYDGSGQQLTSGGCDVETTVCTSSSEELMLPDDVVDFQDGRYKITITPRSVKLHYVNISICGYPVKSSMEISVLDSLPFENPPGGYDKPSGMNVDINSKTVFVVDSRHASKLYMYDDDGKFKSELSFQKSFLPNKSCQIGINEAGQLILLIFQLRRVITCSTDGQIVDRWDCATENQRPANLTLSKDGHLIIGDSQLQELFIYRPNGDVTGRISLQEGSLEVGFNNVCVDRNRDVLVATHLPPYDILRYNMIGNASSRLVSPAKTPQLAAAVTPEGRALIVSVLEAILVLEFSPSLMEVAVLKEFRTDYIYTKLAVVNDGCFVAFDAGTTHLAKYFYNCITKSIPQQHAESLPLPHQPQVNQELEEETSSDRE